MLGYVPEHTIVYESIGGGTAGTALQGSNVLTFDPFFIKQNQKKYIEEIVVHEAAHLICYILHPEAKQCHGPEWKRIMNILGAPASRFHTFSALNAPKTHPRPYHYSCSCEGKIFNLTERMHKSISLGKHRQCPLCKTRIILSKVSK